MAESSKQLELESFLKQFSYLSNLGYNTFLNISSNNGSITVNLHAKLENVNGVVDKNSVPEPPMHETSTTESLNSKSLKPSRSRRRERRKFQKKLTSQLVSNHVSELQRNESNTSVSKSKLSESQSNPSTTMV